MYSAFIDLLIALPHASSALKVILNCSFYRSQRQHSVAGICVFAFRSDRDTPASPSGIMPGVVAPSLPSNDERGMCQHNFSMNQFGGTCKIICSAHHSTNIRNVIQIFRKRDCQETERSDQSQTWRDFLFNRTRGCRRQCLDYSKRSTSSTARHGYRYAFNVAQEYPFRGHICSWACISYVWSSDRASILTVSCKFCLPVGIGAFVAQHQHIPKQTVSLFVVIHGGAHFSDGGKPSIESTGIGSHYSSVESSHVLGPYSSPHRPVISKGKPSSSNLPGTKEKPQ